jgi:hypothetical protein
LQVVVQTFSGFFGSQTIKESNKSTRFGSQNIDRGQFTEGVKLVTKKKEREEM